MPRPLSSPIEESYCATTKKQNHAICISIAGRARHSLPAVIDPAPAAPAIHSQSRDSKTHATKELVT